MDRKKQMVHYIRNNYKTAKTYGQKVSKIDNERFLAAVKKCHRQLYCFPITTDAEKIGYYIQKMTLGQLGEGAMMELLAYLHCSQSRPARHARLPS